MRVLIVAAAAALLALPSEAAAARDTRDANGVVFRAAGGGRYFHPLASFGSLNREVTARHPRRARRLARILVLRAERHGRFGLVWRYRVPGSDRAAWTSGLAQAVAAQALARAGRMEEARRAFLAIPNGLLTRLPQGPWIKLYGYSDVVVLNAQLQAALSVGEYARLARDARAKRLARELRRSARALLPRFTTDSWSLYALGGRPATLEYHSYVASLLWKLSARQGGGIWARYAARFRHDLRVPPKVRAGGVAAPVAPVADGFRDSTEIKFWLSKPAYVTFRIGGDAWSQSFGRGWQTFTWAPERIPVGRHGVSGLAEDAAGNAARFRLPPVTIERDVVPPAVRAQLAGTHVAWRASDAGSPWFDVELERATGARVHVTKLGRFDRRGRAHLAVPPKPMHDVALVVRDSSGNVTRLPLCVVG